VLPPDSSQSLAGLSQLEQTRFEKAGQAFEREQWDYAVSACAAVLAAHPECVPVRRLHYAALKRKIPPRGAWLRTLVGGLGELWQAVAFSQKTVYASEAAKRFARAECFVQRNPYHTAALRQLAEAASELGWPQTALFAYEAIREVEPENRANLLALGAALLALGRATDALKIADALLAKNAVDGDAQSLMRRAAIAQTMQRGNGRATRSHGSHRARNAE